MIIIFSKVLYNVVHLYALHLHLHLSKPNNTSKYI